MGRIRLVFLGLALLLGISTAALVARAVHDASREAERDRRTLAARVFDEMERELSALVEREEARPVAHYRFSFAPDGASEGTRVRSPLAEGPREPGVVAWFQIEPDGSLRSPHRPGPEDPPSTREGWRAGPRLAADLARALAVVERLRGEALAGRAPDPAQAPATTVFLDDGSRQAPPAPGDASGARARAEEASARNAEPRFESETATGKRSELHAALQSLNRGMEQRAARERKFEPVPPALDAAELRVALADAPERASEAAMRAADPPMRRVAEVEPGEGKSVAPGSANARASGPGRAAAPAAGAVEKTQRRKSADPVRKTQRRKSAGAGRLTRAPAAASRPAAVAVDPFVGRRVDRAHLVLVRTVWLGERALRQGLVIDVPALEARLRRTVGTDGPIGASLRFADATAGAPRAPDAPDGPAGYRHRFGEPFQSLAVTLALPPLAGGRGAGTVVLLAILLFAVGVAGLFALYRMIAVRVAFAERRSQFAAAVSHELKTPLTAIRLYAEMLRDGLVRDDTRRAEYYATITAESERLSRLIDNVLEFSRLEKGTREIRLVTADLGAVVEEAAAVVRPHAESQGFALELALEPGLPPVRFDRDGLLQVLVNLVDNALKYAADGADRRIRITCRREAGGVKLAVRDHGPGVPAEHLGRIFEPFYRGQDELTRTVRGTGLGLALVRGLAEGMGAEIQGRNRPDGGFEVQLSFDGVA